MTRLNGTPRELISDDSATNPTVSPDGRRIAFESTRTGNQEIFVRRFGGATTQVTTNPADDWNPQFLPDGRLAFYSDRDGDTDAYALRGGKLSRIGEEIAVAGPDGRRIAKVRCPRRQCDIYLYRRDGSLIRQLTSTPGPELDPAFSPDGRRILFVAQSRKPSPRPEWVVHVMRADGSRERQVTRQSGRWQFEPAWSTDGRFVVYNEASGWSGSGDNHVYTAPIRTGERTLVPAAITTTALPSAGAARTALSLRSEAAGSGPEDRRVPAREAVARSARRRAFRRARRTRPSPR